MARGDIEISHAAFDELASNKAVTYLRDLLVALAVLPAYHAKLERVSPWLDGAPRHPARRPGRADRALRPLARSAQAASTKDKPGISPTVQCRRGRTTIVSAMRFLAWLEERQRTSLPLAQGDLDALRRRAAREARRGRLPSCAGSSGPDSPAMELPTRQPGQPHVALSDAQRWAHVEHAPPRRQHPALHPDRRSLHTAVRPAADEGRVGCSRARSAGTSTVVSRSRSTLRDRAALNRSMVWSSTSSPAAVKPPTPAAPNIGCSPEASRATTSATESIRSQLVAAASNRPRPARPRCSGSAAEIPTPILADILGLGHHRSQMGSSHVVDWSKYTAAARHSPRGNRTHFEYDPPPTVGLARGGR